MEAITSKFSSIVLLLSLIGMLAYASADSGYRKPQLEGYTLPKPATPKEELPVYQKSVPKIPTKPVMPKEEHGAYQKTIPKMPTKPVMPKEEHGAYQNTVPKIPTKPVMPKEEHGAYQKIIPKMPTKPVMPKEEHGAYQNTVPKIPTKPVMPEKSIPKPLTKPVIPKHEKEGYGSYPKLPTKPEIPKKEHEAYGVNHPKIPIDQKPSLPKVPEHPKNIAVQGIIYCNYGSKLVPLQGATARVTCLTVRKDGYESAPFSFSSCPADKKGYFLAKIPSSKLPKDDQWGITECKAFLENSPWTSCKVPEDTNGGIKGARLIFSRHLNRDGFCLSSVGPFMYNPGHQSSPKEGY